MQQHDTGMSARRLAAAHERRRARQSDQEPDLEAAFRALSGPERERLRVAHLERRNRHGDGGTTGR